MILTAPCSMLRDVEFFKAKLQHIDGFGSTGDYLIDIVKAKQVRSAAPPATEKKSEDFFDAEKEAATPGAEDGENAKEPAGSETK